MRLSTMSSRWWLNGILRVWVTKKTMEFSNGITSRRHLQLCAKCWARRSKEQYRHGWSMSVLQKTSPHTRTMLAEKIWRRPQGQGQDIITEFEENLQSSRRDPTTRRTQTSSRKVMRSTSHTFQGMTIGGNRIEDLMNTDKYHQVEKQKQRKCMCEATTS